jgi:hypothetical protein
MLRTPMLLQDALLMRAHLGLEVAIAQHDLVHVPSSGGDTCSSIAEHRIRNNVAEHATSSQALRPLSPAYTTTDTPGLLGSLSAKEGS